jgi:hypothetical protein
MGTLSGSAEAGSCRSRRRRRRPANEHDLK